MIQNKRFFTIGFLLFASSLFLFDYGPQNTLGLIIELNIIFLNAIIGGIALIGLTIILFSMNLDTQNSNKS